MTTRRALSLGAMACAYIADGEGADVLDWIEAAAYLRRLLAAARPEPVGAWEWYSKARAPRKKP